MERTNNNPASWLSGYSDSLESYFLRERQFESGRCRNPFLVLRSSCLLAFVANVLVGAIVRRALPCLPRKRHFFRLAVLGEASAPRLQLT